MAGSFRIRSSEFSIGELPEVGFVGVVVIGLQVAEHGRHRVCAVIGDGYGLGVAQFREGLHVEAIISVGVVALGGCDVGLVGESLSCERANSRIVATLGKVVADLVLVLASAEFAGGPGREVI